MLTAPGNQGHQRSKGQPFVAVEVWKHSGSVCDCQDLQKCIDLKSQLPLTCFELGNTPNFSLPVGLPCLRTNAKVNSIPKTLTCNIHRCDDAVPPPLAPPPTTPSFQFASWREASRPGLSRSELRSSFIEHFQHKRQLPNTPIPATSQPVNMESPLFNRS